MLYVQRNKAKRLRRTLLSPGFAFALQEKWDRDMVGIILSRKCSMLSLDGEFDSKLERQLQNIDGHTAGKVTVRYNIPAASIPFEISGRVFGTGLQTAPGWVRRLCSHKYYYDLDIENCFPEILLQIKQKKHVEIDTPRLERYVAEREAILAEDMQQVPGLTRNEAKQQYLKIMFGGGESDYETEFLAAYKKEIVYIIDHLWHLQEYRSIRMYVESNRAEKRNVKGSFLSHVIGTVEWKIIDVAMKRVAEPDMGFRVGVYVFDGFMVERKRGVEAFPSSHLTELSRAVVEATGYRVKFVEKPLKPTVEDIERIRPAFNNMTSRSKWDARKAFREIGKLVNELNIDPKPENVAFFHDAIIPIMNQAFAKLESSPAVVVTRSVGMRGPNDITYKRYKEDDARKNWKPHVYFVNDGEKREMVAPFETWMKSDKALSYGDICFNPRPYDHPECASPFHINTFVGIAYPPKQKFTAAQCQSLEQNELKPFWGHIRTIWCQGDEELYEYVKRWIWSKVTRPSYRLECALILQSEQGAGKGIVVEKVAELLGEQYMSKPSSLEQITGNNFNKQFFENCLIMFLDEAFYAGSKATKNQVKTIITDRWVTINEKFMPKYSVESFLSMVLASNETHVINRDVKARRFFNLALSNELAGNHADASAARQYFNAIQDVDNQLLSDYLHSIDVPANWTGRNFPKTLEGEEQSILSFNKLEEFVHNMMIDPTVIQHCRLEYQKEPPLSRDTFRMSQNGDHDLLEGTYLKSEIFKTFQSSCNRSFVKSRGELTKYIKYHIPSTTEPDYRPRIWGKQYYLITFPTLETARAEYKVKKGLTHTVFE